MRKTHSFWIVITFVVLFVPHEIFTALVVPAAPITDENVGILSKTQWEIMGESSLLIPEQRWLFLENGKQVRERKAQMFFHNTTADEVTQLIRDYRRLHEWMNHADETQLLVQHNKHFWVIFTIFKLPWPLRNKYLITEVLEEQHPFLPLVIFRIRSSNQYKPPYECTVNDFGHYESIWKIYAIDNKLTYASFSAYSTADPQFPRWLQDPIINRSFIKSMESFYQMFQQ
jgi:hypothetical protein